MAMEITIPNFEEDCNAAVTAVSSHPRSTLILDVPFEAGSYHLYILDPRRIDGSGPLPFPVHQSGFARIFEAVHPEEGRSANPVVVAMERNCNVRIPAAPSYLSVTGRRSFDPLIVPSLRAESGQHAICNQLPFLLRRCQDSCAACRRGLDCRRISGACWPSRERLAFHVLSGDRLLGKQKSSSSPDIPSN